MGAGYRAMVGLIRGYKGPETVSNLVGTYEGHNAPGLADHIRKIAHGMHVKPGQHLDLSNPSVMAGLATGMTEFEQHHNRSHSALYAVIYKAITDGMSAAKPAQVHVHASGTNPGSRTALSAHAAAHG
jgi:hypothetical protein